MLERWLIYVLFCAEGPISAPVCRPFWTWVMAGLLVAGVIGVGAVFWGMISYRWKLAAALRAEEERRRLDAEALEQRRWRGDEAYPDVANAEQRIREALEEKRKRDGEEAARAGKAT